MIPTMRVLITGGAGFIGSNLVKRTLDEGWTVTVVDDLSNGHLDFIRDGNRIPNFWGLDFTDQVILDAIKRQQFDVVFHLAALPRVSYSVEHPLQTNDTNVTKTLKLMDACRGNINRFVFASSSSVYGGADNLPTQESEPKHPQSPYALQKLIIEDYLKLWHKLYGMDSAHMRFFNVFGPNQLGSSPYSTAVSAWLTAIKEGRPMRSDGDGSQTRDMCYVDNVTEALTLAAKYKGTIGADAFNVACGDKVSNAEILESLKKRYPNAQVLNAPWRPGDVMHTLADVSKAKNVLGYVPIVKFWEGLERTIKWVEESELVSLRQTV